MPSSKFYWPHVSYFPENVGDIVQLTQAVSTFGLPSLCRRPDWHPHRSSAHPIAGRLVTPGHTSEAKRTADSRAGMAAER